VCYYACQRPSGGCCLLDAAWAIREAMKVCNEAEDMISAGAVGDLLHEAFQHAAELLDVADEELQVVDLPHLHDDGSSIVQTACKASRSARYDPLNKPMPLELFPFRYRDPLTGKWVKARYGSR
jgi:hypothetical protein